MSDESKRFFSFLKSNYEEYFFNNHILDILSDKKKSNRNLFHNCAYYNNINLDNPNILPTTKDIYYDTNYFNVIFSNDLLEYDADYKTTLENIYKMLAPNGLLCIVCGSNNHEKDVKKMKNGYYKNLDINDFDKVLHLNHSFYSWNSYYNTKSKEIFFIGIKKNLFHIDIPKIEPYKGEFIINTKNQIKN
jgi:SAM-dependent methyltransferase